MSVDPASAAAGPSGRAREVERATWVSVATNVVLTVLQIAIGLFSHAQSLVADGLHTLSDLLGDFLVMVAGRQGAHPADEKHPYGHGRIETAASLLLGMVLAGVGAGFLLSAGARLQSPDALPELHPAALAMALVTLAAKEGLFRYVLAVAQRLRSPMLVANAWHARADAASSLVVAVGIGGSLAGYRFLEPLAAALVGFMIARMGASLAFEALRELIDTGVSAEEVAAIRRSTLGVPGVLGVHELRTRRMAQRILVDAHVRVDARIGVSEGHRIAELVRARIREAHSDVLDVLVHVDTDEDERLGLGAELPGRDALEAALRDLLGPGVPLLRAPVFHYVDDAVEAEIHLAPEWLRDAARIADLNVRLDRAAAAGPFRSITVWCRIAP